MADIIGYFPATLAVDINTRTPLRDVEAKVYAIADTDFSNPLSVTDMAGVPLNGNAVVSNSDGIFPEFRVPSGITQVMLKAGQALTPMTSISVYAEAAQRSAEAAAKAVEGVTEKFEEIVSDSGVVVTTDERLPQPAVEDDTFVRAITDNRDRVIIGLRRDGSVLVPDLAATWARLGEMTSGKINGVEISSSLASITGYRRVWTDDQDNVLLGIRPDGTLHIPSLEANIATTSGVPTKYKASYDDKERAIVSGPGVTLAGHSMLAGAANAISAALSGVSVVSLSVGGESSRTIAARQGGQPLLLVPSGGSLPASGSVDVDLLWADGPIAGGWPLLQGATSYAGTLVLPSGTRVAGTFGIVRDPSATQYVHHAGDRYTFTRSTNGSAITVNRPAPFYADVATPRRSDIFVYWIARNNINEVDQAIGDLQAMIQRQDNLAKRWLVLSEHNSATEPSGSGNFANVTSYNQRARALAGRRFVDTRQYLIDYGLADAGITPTTQDQTDIANGVVPTSLRSDNLHLNASGSAVVAQLIRRRLIELEWITP